MGQWLLPTIPTNITHTHVRSHVGFSPTKKVTGWGPKLPSCKRRKPGPVTLFTNENSGILKSHGPWHLPPIPTNITHTHVRSHVDFSSTKMLRTEVQNYPHVNVGARACDTLTKWELRILKGHVPMTFCVKRPLRPPAIARKIME